MQRPLAITDVETTGFDAQRHEIIEIGLVLVAQDSFKIIDEFECKIKPLHPRNATKQATELNGYNAKDWREATDLKTAMKVYGAKTKNALFLSHNVFFDWSFINEAFKQSGVEDLMDYHRIDLFSLGWSRSASLEGLTKFNLDEIAKHFGISKEPLPHRALNGARLAYAVLQKLKGYSRESAEGP